VMAHPDDEALNTFSTGGTGNVMAILHSMGWDVNLVAKIGADRAGDYVNTDLKTCGVDTRFVIQSRDVLTPIYILHHGRNGHFFTKSCPSCGKPFPPYTPITNDDLDSMHPEWPEAVQVFYYDKLSPAIVDLAREYQSRSALVYFEPNRIEDEKLFRESVRIADIVKYSGERREGMNTLIDEARPPLEIETLGKDGLRFRMVTQGGRGDWIRVESCPPACFKDAAGAGDWLTASLIDSLAGKGIDRLRLADLSFLISVMREGQRLSARNCSFTGARGVMYEEIGIQTGTEYCPHCIK